MAERLTGKDIRNTTILKVDKNNMYIYNTTTEDGEEETVISCDAITKLGELEDILEKYGIENLDELSNALEFAKTVEQTLSEHGIKDNEELDSALIKLIEARAFEKKIKLLETDRDTWKKACELACEREDDCYVYDNIHRAYEFYQQAKKEESRC